MEPIKYAVFTMDVEAFSDTECFSRSALPVDVDVMDGFDEYIRILDKYSIKSTLFTVGALAPEIADRLHSCLANGHRLALHSYQHRAPMQQSPEQFRQEIAQAREMLQDMFDTEVIGFRAPCFSIDRQRLDILHELGLRYDSSHLDFSAARHTVSLDLSDFDQLRDGVYCRNGFFEFGLSKCKVFGKSYPISGGGYVRLSNWGVIKSIIRRHLVNNDYYVFYLHPFELSRQKLPLLKGLKSYDKYYLKSGISSYGKHIEQLILMLQKFGYRFVTFEQLTELLSTP